MSKQIFLSYSTDDTAAATTVHDHLEAEGIPCWMAPRDIAPGLEYGGQIIDAIEACAVLVLVLSESSNRSRFVLNEVERAVSKNKIIMPIRIHAVQPSRSLEFFISNAQWIDGWEGDATKALYTLVQAVRGHLGDQHTERPTSQSPISIVKPPPPHNLPHQLTAFIGREAELIALDRLLSQREVRLITILGPGGMGKTRLSLATAERHLNNAQFTNGIYFVALAPLSDTRHILPTLAEALSFSLQSDGKAGGAQQLLDYLRGKQMLLVFDNFEHLLDGAHLVAQILQAAPHVRVLVTSRERLRVPGEHLFPIQGLDFHEPVGNGSEPGSAAVLLFLQGARQIQPELELSGDEHAHVVRICQLVGGMPLGIELAAAWTEVLSLQEIAAEIQRSLDFLAAERRGGQEHHRSVRAVFDSTWQRLDPAEQAVFARLAIFRGGFTRDAAEQVAGASLRLLSALVGKSLIQHDREHGRYTVHELLRQFGEEKLDEEKLDAVAQARHEAHERHCTYYTTFVRGQEPRLKGREQAAAVSDIEVEIENVRLAWQWAVAHRDVEAIDRALEGFWIFCLIKSWQREALALFRAVATALHTEEPAGRQGIVLSRVLARQASVTTFVDNQLGSVTIAESAESLFRRSLAIATRLNARAAQALPMMGLAMAAAHEGDIEQANQLLPEAMTIFTEEHDRWQMSIALRQLGSQHEQMAQYQEAIDYYYQSAAVSAETGDMRNLGRAFMLMGWTYCWLDKYEEAQQAYMKGMEASIASGDRSDIAFGTLEFGLLAWRMGDFDTARQRAEESLALFQEMGLTYYQNAPRTLLGQVACSVGDYTRARAYFCQALELQLQAGNLDIRYGTVVHALIGMATLFTKQGMPDQACELLDLVLSHPAPDLHLKHWAAEVRAEAALALSAPETVPERPLHAVVAELLGH